MAGGLTLALALSVGIPAAASAEPAAPAAAAAAALGPTVTATGTGPTGHTVTFRHQAPEGVESVQIFGEWLFSKASSVTTLTSADLRTGADWLPGDILAGYNNGWLTVPMTEGEDGVWEYTTPLPSGTFSYTFTYDCTSPTATGCARIQDPANPVWSAGLPGAGVQTLSQVYVPQSAAVPTYDNDYQDPTAAAAKGTLENRSYPSPLSTNPVGTHHVSVYLPPGYDAERAEPYPTLYLSHGAGGNDTDWTTQGGAQHILDNALASGDVAEMVMVSTDFNGLPGGSQGYADELRTNVIPFIEAGYNVSVEREDRAFGGLSAGGGRAVVIMQDNPDLFGYVGAWSAAGAFTPPTPAQVANLQQATALHLGTGLQDVLANINVNSVNRSNAYVALGLPVVQDDFDGIHSWDVWRQLLRDYLHTVAFRTTTTTVTAGDAVAGGSTSLVAQVDAVSVGADPSGTVTFHAGTDASGAVLGTAEVAADGSATTEVVFAEAGATSVVAVFDGGDVHNASTSEAVTLEVLAFTDIADNQFVGEISWLAEANISAGWSNGDGTFSYRPLASIARDAMAAFLYRAAGSPDFTPPTTSPFTDVPTTNQFYTEIAWLSEKGISTGWDNGDGTFSFRPLEPIARDAMAAFLHRSAGSPVVALPATSPFEDVRPDNQFYAEIAYVHAEGIATGWAGNDGRDYYQPLAPVARDAMAAFLYRALDREV
ncbi:hypothetical protein C8046_12530 [Serinibacter arcticus]|uniref:SLH domain-containing protein n=1 Tax=Serinibacter arcticus TaxID=1655435 RepID=A0A2U1ZWK5_9MICO|nr:hypothetical protein C8046_12530 [Serinibacter arcticus]